MGYQGRIYQSMEILDATAIDGDDFMSRVSMFDFLFQWHKRDSFLKRLITWDVAWMLYQNVHLI